MEQIATETESDNLTLKEKAEILVNLFQTMAAKRNIVLKLNDVSEGRSTTSTSVSQLLKQKENFSASIKPPSEVINSAL